MSFGDPSKSRQGGSGVLKKIQIKIKRCRRRLTNERIVRRKESNILEMDVSAVAVIELDVDKVRVELRVDGHRIGDGSGVKVVVLLAPVGADTRARDQNLCRRNSDLENLK